MRRLKHTCVSMLIFGMLVLTEGHCLQDCCIDRSVLCFFCGDLVGSASNKLLFKKRAWGKANNLLKEILHGCHLDPPGQSFCATKFNQKGEQMKNKCRFELLTCI